MTKAPTIQETLALIGKAIDETNAGMEAIFMLLIDKGIATPEEIQAAYREKLARKAAALKAAIDLKKKEKGKS
jgi:hypothetical protein